jgi:hypothetical protein
MPDVSKLEKYLKELADGTKDALQKRLISSYQGVNPKRSMEEELGKILTEVMNREN